MPMNYGWPNTPQGIKLFYVADQQDTIFKTTFRTVSRQNLGRDPIASVKIPECGGGGASHQPAFMNNCSTISHRIKRRILILQTKFGQKGHF